MKQIDVDTMGKILGYWIREHWTEGFTEEELENMINNEKTVDTTQKLHAHWIGSEICDDGFCRICKVVCDRNGFVTETDMPCVCSNCGEILISRDGHAIKGRYCPNCGAKMD